MNGSKWSRCWFRLREIDGFRLGLAVAAVARELQCNTGDQGPADRSAWRGMASRSDESLRSEQRQFLLHLRRPLVGDAGVPSRSAIQQPIRALEHLGDAQWVDDRPA